jgi:signal transduction histidine kinase
MAEVATGVLHNFGNVLNSVNISATVVSESLKKSRASNLSHVAALFEEHAADLGAFLTADPKGRRLPVYLGQLAGHLAAEQVAMLKELELLRKNIEHIKDIVAMQQSYARASGVTEQVNVSELIEDALNLNAGALVRHQVEVIRQYQARPTLTLDKHKVLQILVNLIRNAKYACDESGRADKRLTVQVTNGGGRVKIAVIDNGVGIPLENLTRIFNHGFTTRKEGHGFGLHSGALAARELGGALTVHSEGVGKGAGFTLELPVEPSTAVNGNRKEGASVGLVRELAIPFRQRPQGGDNSADAASPEPEVSVTG